MADNIGTLNREGWELYPDPEITGQYYAVSKTSDCTPIGIVQNEEGDPRISLLLGFSVTPPSPHEGDQYDWDGMVLGTYDNLDAAVEHAERLQEL